MLKQIEGSLGIAEAVALCRPGAVCAYPISPQTHIVENVGKLVKQGTLKDCEFINVESEFAAISVSIGASAGGVRTYTATASQGLLYMTEGVYNASGLGLPIVMTVASRAIGAPINIWNDHSDSLSQRDSGWLQLFCESNQDALDTHIMAFKIAETVGLPVMVCMDGFVLTHAFERLDVPSQEMIDSFLPPYEPKEYLDPKEPISMGAMVGPEAFTEVRLLQQRKMVKALQVIEDVTKEYRALTGRNSGGLLDCYNCENADLKLVILGSSVGTAKDAVDELKKKGINVGIISLKSYRPFPYEAMRAAIGDTKKVVCLERAFSFGARGIICPEVKRAVEGTDTKVYTAIAGLGGRAILGSTIDNIVDYALNDKFTEEVTWVDVDHKVLNNYLQSAEGVTFPEGPIADSALKDSLRNVRA
ncbi:transketolase C-terminal domain-containing protein [Succinatimonas hippei]|uniref:Pyruvate flavodoxin/ferredoxin oxidoreductase, thiamine diP-binding domain protein n=1 Tax=Succinatimonas hippei (strain DSM 22608 / JCM 16073 / KCTC 15190 / YIT 12066) TaxID=762983 RepID=E8LHV4_SUCHY|nr:transketolase C-terminal domain-containing protein [Succinatimonas hippei]EFY07892.1 pyruvate flavodoxin/ferredoxin oxidoreductase, thiamine diP-binding domain protein [Succinatimonas hippei YIT 12066]MCL1603994.1 pyruvate ferredoxin oxidoreductase [Succinatimonas hippei]